MKTSNARIPYFIHEIKVHIHFCAFLRPTYIEQIIDMATRVHVSFYGCAGCAYMHACVCACVYVCICGMWEVGGLEVMRKTLDEVLWCICLSN